MCRIGSTAAGGRQGWHFLQGLSPSCTSFCRSFRTLRAFHSADILLVRSLRQPLRSEGLPSLNSSMACTYMQAVAAFRPSTMRVRAATRWICDKL